MDPEIVTFNVICHFISTSQPGPALFSFKLQNFHV
jgi:hypothetical protein